MCMPNAISKLSKVVSELNYNESNQLNSFKYLTLYSIYVMDPSVCLAHYRINHSNVDHVLMTHSSITHDAQILR